MNPARAAALLALAALASAAAAQSAPPEALPAPDPWLAPALVYDGDVVGNLRGGARCGSTYVGNLHLKLTAKGDAIGLPGSSAFVDVRSQVCACFNAAGGGIPWPRCSS